jgi:hypothetical protein
MDLKGLSPSDAIAAIAPGAAGEWIKVKNRARPAFERAMLIALSKRTGSRSGDTA